MPKRIVYKNEEGKVCVVIPAPNCPLTVEEIAAKDVPIGRSFQIVDDADVPADRTFRDAWDLDAKGAVVVDMPKARELHKASLRRLRTPKLGALDVDFMRAVEEGNAARQQELRAAKDALRDLTDDPIIEAAKTPEELKQAIPDVLREKGRPATTVARAPRTR